MWICSYKWGKTFLKSSFIFSYPMLVVSLLYSTDQYLDTSRALHLFNLRELRRCTAALLDWYITLVYIHSCVNGASKNFIITAAHQSWFLCWSVSLRVCRRARITRKILIFRECKFRVVLHWIKPLRFLPSCVHMWDPCTQTCWMCVCWWLYLPHC